MMGGVLGSRIGSERVEWGEVVRVDGRNGGIEILKEDWR